MLGLHGGRAENGELQAMCEMRGIPFTGSGSASSHLAFDKVAAKRFAAIAGVKAPVGIALEDIERGAGRIRQADRKTGAGWIELRPDLRQFEAGPRRRPQRGQDRRISDRAVRLRASKPPAACWNSSDGIGVFAAADRDRPGRRRLRLHRQISAKSTQEICPGRFSPGNHRRDHGSGAEGASRAVVPRLFPHRLHRLGERADLSRNQYPAGPDRGLALSQGAQGAWASSSPISCRTRSRWRSSARRTSAAAGSGLPGNRPARFPQPILTNMGQMAHTVDQNAP